MWQSQNVNSLHSHRKQGDSNHNQIQDIEGIATEGALVHECTIYCHLSVRYDTVKPRILNQDNDFVLQEKE